MLQFGLGESAALTTAVFWSVSCLIHVTASSRLGPTVMLTVRQPLAVTALALIVYFEGDTLSYSLYAGLLVFVSGFFGVALTDWLFFHAIQLAGVRTAQVCQSSYVSLTALMGVIFLGEHIGVKGVLGIALGTLGSIMVIAAESQDSAQTKDKKGQRKGVIFAFTSAAIYALSLIFSREALNLGVPPATAAFLRTFAALIALNTALLYTHNLKKAYTSLKNDRTSIYLLLAGCVLGTAGGMWLSMKALANTQTAIATMLMGLQMVFVPILSWFVERRRANPKTFVGIGLAFAGATIVLMR